MSNAIYLKCLKGAAVVAVLVLSLFAIGAIDSRPSGVVAGVSHQYTGYDRDDSVAAAAYQVNRDFNQCLRTIPNTTLWTPTAYKIQYGTCCVELLYGKGLVDEINGFEYGPVKSLYRLACQDDDEESVGHRVPGPEVRRKARVEALMARPAP